MSNVMPKLIESPSNNKTLQQYIGQTQLSKKLCKNCPKFCQIIMNYSFFSHSGSSLASGIQTLRAYSLPLSLAQFIKFYLAMQWLNRAF